MPGGRDVAETHEGKDIPMNITNFATVLEAIIQHNQKLLNKGCAVKDYLVPMAWGDPGLGKSDIAEATAHDLGLELIYPVVFAVRRSRYEGRDIRQVVDPRRRLHEFGVGPRGVLARG
jgi:replication-associated recombination protein RarA